MPRREELSGPATAASEALREWSRAADTPHGSSLADPQAESPSLIRIDAPHVLGDRENDETAAASAEQPDRADEPVGIDLAELPLQSISQFQLQAEQLSAHLRAQEYQLDRREAQLHSELAQQESSARGMRLWLQERQQDIAEREAVLASRAEELQRREQDVAQLEQQFEQRQAQWLAESQLPVDAAPFRELPDVSPQAVTALEQEIAESTAAAELAAAEASAMIAAANAAAAKQQADDRLADALRIYRQLMSLLIAARRFIGGEPVHDATQSDAAAGDAPSSADLLRLDAELRAALEQLAGRQQNLEESEILLADGQVDLDRGRQQLATERQAFDEECELQRGRLADDRLREQEELDRRASLLTAREEHLARRSTAVDQLRTEVLRAQRETLELRLATDEIWAQLAASVPPPALTQSLVRVRSQLAEQYRREQAELSQQRTELESLAERLAGQHEKLSSQRQEIERRAVEERAQIERHAARLSARERQFGERQREMAQQRQRHEQDRRVYEAEIRRLLAELRRK